MLDNSNCTPFFDECNGNSNITLDQLFKLMVRKDANGCPVLPITGNIIVAPGAPVMNRYRFNSELTRPATQTPANPPFFNYGGALNDAPIVTDVDGLLKSFDLSTIPGLTPATILRVLGGNFMVSSTRKNSSFAGKIHLFNGVVTQPGDNNVLNLNFVDSQNYVGTLDLNLTQVNSAHQGFGKIEGKFSDMYFHSGADAKLYYIVEASSNAELGLSSNIKLNLLLEK